MWKQRRGLGEAGNVAGPDVAHGSPGRPSGLCSPYNDRGNKAETGMTWCLRASCTLGPLLTAEPGRVTGTSASVCTPGPLPQGSARFLGVGSAGNQDATPPPWSSSGSSPSPHPLLLKQSPRPAQSAWGPDGGNGVPSPGRGRPRRLETLPSGTSFCPSPTSAPFQVLVSRVSREGHGLCSFHSHTTAVPPRLRSDCVSARLLGRLQASRTGELDRVSGRACERQTTRA